MLLCHSLARSAHLLFGLVMPCQLHLSIHMIGGYLRSLLQRLRYASNCLAGLAGEGGPANFCGKRAARCLTCTPHNATMGQCHVPPSASTIEDSFSFFLRLQHTKQVHRARLSFNHIQLVTCPRRRSDTVLFLSRPTSFPSTSGGFRPYIVSLARTLSGTEDV